MMHIIKYSLKVYTRNKSQMFWVLMFPIILGFFFKTAFSGLSDVDAFSSIPVAVICESKESEAAFKQICENVNMNDQPLLNPDFHMSEETALEKLENNDIYGIIYWGEKLTLKVSANTGDDNTKQSILDSFVSQYNATTSIMQEIAQTHPEKIDDAMKSVTNHVTYNEAHRYTSGNPENYTQYFYNLMAMACLFTTLAGLEITMNNQGNLSDLGVRRNISPTNKLMLSVCELLSGLIFNYVLNVIAFAFIIIVLKIDLTFHLPYALLAIFISTMASMALGFFIGAIPTKKRGMKEAIGIVIILFSCFLSGLMIGSMRIVIEDICPLINRMNPAALISDSFYSLANYEDFGRYYQDIGMLFILAVIFTIGGFLLTRRKKYASI